MGTLFTLMFVLVPLFIAAVFVLMIGIFVVVAVKGIAQWTDNNAQPVLTFPVRIATKRLHVSGGGQDSGASTSYRTAYTSPHGKEGLGLGAVELWRGCSGSGSAGSAEGAVPI